MIAIGSFPLWLAPAQVRILPVSNVNEAIVNKCKELADKFKDAGLRAEIDYSSERISKMIRNAEVEKVPIVLAVGQNEVNTGNLSVRVRKHGQLSIPVPEEELVKILSDGVKNCYEDDELIAALKR
jgi:threonyl-tRNA synthetase